jgi:predicted transposase/invertase (TIGR01784 family)
MAGKVLLEISRDEQERARLMSEYKYELDTQSRIVDAKREGIREGVQKGIQKGIQKGRQKGKQEGRAERDLEVARKALSEGFSPDVVQKITGLDIETIKNLAAAAQE